MISESNWSWLPKNKRVVVEDKPEPPPEPQLPEAAWRGIFAD
jgi:hypothetical protein